MGEFLSPADASRRAAYVRSASPFLADITADMLLPATSTFLVFADIAADNKTLFADKIVGMVRSVPRRPPAGSCPDATAHLWS